MDFSDYSAVRASQRPFRPKRRVTGRYLSISVQRREVEEEGLSQRDAVDWVVEIVTLVELHLDKERREKLRNCRNICKFNLKKKKKKKVSRAQR